MELVNFPKDADFVAIHGMDQRSINDTHLLVALINHRLDRSVVELFTLALPKPNESVDKLKLIYLRTVHDESVYAPNDVALVDAAGSFYVTNDHKYGLL